MFILYHTQLKIVRSARILINGKKVKKMYLFKSNVKHKAVSFSETNKYLMFTTMERRSKIVKLGK